VTIRTLDVGGDKPTPAIPLPKEENPFLGYRAVRIYKEHEPIITTQLRALLRASHVGKLRILFPMISSLDEILELKRRIAEIRKTLDAEGVPHDPNLEIGIMVEIPAAAFFIAEASREVDFLSIGTNDLAQYFLAVDRTNESVAHLYSWLHPAFLKLLAMIVDGARASGRWVGLCGEMASHEKYLPLLAGLGLDEVSCAPQSVPAIKAALARQTVEESRALLHAAASKGSVAEVEALLADHQSRRASEAIIATELVLLDSSAATKEEAMRELVDLLDLSDRIGDRDAVEDALWHREGIAPTEIGFGLAIPHCSSIHVRENSLAVVRLAAPIAWGAPESEPTGMIVAIAVKAGAYEKEHLKILATLARALMHEDFRGKLTAAASAEEVARLLRERVLGTS
jgi:multiphosphoryl transfer protein